MLHLNHQHSSTRRTLWTTLEDKRFHRENYIFKVKMSRPMILLWVSSLKIECAKRTLTDERPSNSADLARETHNQRQVKMTEWYSSSLDKSVLFRSINIVTETHTTAYATSFDFSNSSKCPKSELTFQNRPRWVLETTDREIHRWPRGGISLVGEIRQLTDVENSCAWVPSSSGRPRLNFYSHRHNVLKYNLRIVEIG